MKIGFIGLGIMGKPMARNLMKAGYELVVYTRTKAKIETFVKEGAQGAKSPREVGELSDLVILMLPNSPECDDVIFGMDGLAEGLSSGKAVIDMSSINPLESQKFAKKLSEKGVDFIDAPVSGGEKGAVKATLAVMVGAKEEVFEKYKPVLEVMGSSVVRVGNPGAGNTVKLANQIVVALNIAAVSEAFILAKKAGVDPQTVYQAIRGGSAGSSVLENKSKKMIGRDFNPGFKIDLHTKDLQNVLDTSHEIGVSLPLTANVMEMFQALKANGFGGDDHSAILKHYEKINNIEL